ncbi:MAG: hypothetical protein M9954_08880 [Cyclobacteriaceae bacterium]|nr:hypothetical protein [Cyclobacteriaceae bacterium]MCB9238589.1 hypothetical protein [Flammeovirgaceae bacterium]MCB0499781.1 hypothetical protein [Cyclobacteriaceae bacterium]MCO5271761.1 hypothetical protein [Cyclobacteriaceae bacterium]MCW5902362.1 hypothetical protein [Cyclobacteriaceae bacterium]
MRYVLSLILLAHGLVHLMGFTKAFGLGRMAQLTRQISRIEGTAWLVASTLFVLGGLLFFLENGYWPIVVLAAIVVSQLLIAVAWKDAKFGTLVNGILLVAVILGWGGQRFESGFAKDVKSNLGIPGEAGVALLTEADIKDLPLPVQKYIRYSGSLNQPKVKNVRIVFDGNMRGKGEDWFGFGSLQYNFFAAPSRFFFMKARKWGMPVMGYHRYADGKAGMDIRLLGLVPVAQASGPEMDKAETVTFFNDMCMFVPAALIDKRIEWLPIDKNSAHATFKNGPNLVSATLYFNEDGQLVNFVSDDRYDINEKKQYRFSTPLANYKLVGGRHLPTYGEGVWHYPDGKFTYGKFYLKDIEYNVGSFH